MKKAILLFLVFALFPLLGVHSLPRVTLIDQNDKEHPFSTLVGDAAVVLVYRARDAADDGKSHLRIVREELGNDPEVIRLADLSKVPKLFSGLAFNQLKNKFEDYPYYIDKEGSAVAAFEVEEGEVGLFLYRNGGEEKRLIERFTSKDDLRKKLENFLR